MSENHRYIEACEKCYLARVVHQLYPKNKPEESVSRNMCLINYVNFSLSNFIFEFWTYMMFIIELLCDDVGCDRCAGSKFWSFETSSHILSCPLISSCCLSSKLECHIISTMVHIVHPTYTHMYTYYLSWVLPGRQSHPTWSQRYFFWCSWSLFGGFLKWWYPQNTPKWSFFSRTVGKPMVVGYHHDRKPPFEPGS